MGCIRYSKINFTSHLFPFYGTTIAKSSQSQPIRLISYRQINPTTDGCRTDRIFEQRRRPTRFRGPNRINLCVSLGAKVHTKACLGGGNNKYAFLMINHFRLIKEALERAAQRWGSLYWWMFLFFLRSFILLSAFGPRSDYTKEQSKFSEGFRRKVVEKWAEIKLCINVPIYPPVWIYRTAHWTDNPEVAGSVKVL